MVAACRGFFKLLGAQVRLAGASLGTFLVYVARFMHTSSSFQVAPAMMILGAQRRDLVPPPKA